MMKKFNMHASSIQRLQALFLVLCAVLLTACSSVKFAYHHGDTLLYWWLDSYVDFDGTQAKWVKQDIDRLFQWHRQTQLREYAKLLVKGQHQLSAGATPADLIRDYQDLKNSSELLLAKVTPELADIARSMRPEQITHLEKKFAKGNEEYREKFMSGSTEKRLKVRYEKTLSQFEYWFGDFNREQEALIRKALDARPLDNDIWLEERIRRQQRIVAMLRKVQADKMDKDAAIVQVQGITRDILDRLESPEKKAFYDGYIDATAKLIVYVISITTPKQKAHAHQRIQGLIDDFNAMATDQR